MDALRLKEIVQAISGTLFPGDPETEITGVSRDSREVLENDLFFALIGDSRDGHHFLSEVVSAGCRNLVISDAAALPQEAGLNVIKVSNTTRALANLAYWYIRKQQLQKIAVTGSTGKTTVKDMIACICSCRYKTLKTEGNYNNHIGLPLTVLRLTGDTEAAVFEMGMDRRGEIAFLADLVRPQVGVITNVGVSHLENFEDQEGILQAKLEIAGHLSPADTLVVYADDPLLGRPENYGNYRLLRVGSTGRSDCIISGIREQGEQGSSFYLEHGDEMVRFTLPVPGRHNILNAALAVAAASCVGISMQDAAKALTRFETADKRLRIKGKNGMKILDDTYNASPDSMKAALDTLAALRGIRKVAILGDMNELGGRSAQYHREVGEYAAQKDLDLLITVGKKAVEIGAGAGKDMEKKKIMHFDSGDDIINRIGTLLTSGDIVLVKGSRGMAMEKIVKRIME